MTNSSVVHIFVCCMLNLWTVDKSRNVVLVPSHFYWAPKLTTTGSKFHTWKSCHVNMAVCCSDTSHTVCAQSKNMWDRKRPFVTDEFLCSTLYSGNFISAPVGNFVYRLSKPPNPSRYANGAEYYWAPPAISERSDTANRRAFCLVQDWDCGPGSLASGICCSDGVWPLVTEHDRHAELC